MRSLEATTRSRGMSLIEALVTVALLAVILLALAPLFSQSVNTNASSSQLSVANTLAREKLEELMLYPTTDPRLEVPSTTTKGPAAESPYLDDLPKYYNPSTGETSLDETYSKSAGWYPYSFRRTYTVEPLVSAGVVGDPPVAVNGSGVETAVGFVPNYEFKLVTVTVSPTSGPFPGLRSTTQSAYVRYRNALPN